MDNDQINTLVQSYVDELFADADMTEQENIENKVTVYTICLAFVGHILETHCIVDKANARKLAKIVIDNEKSIDYYLLDSVTRWVVDNIVEEYRQECIELANKM